ncbi:TetR/AcrR family transcriptional regulator [Subtercola boreus]|uniref:HTH tetR-type domain-containing protein n=1 Tax=Subtercola boreus TaxID=120213 RepID=A0A3E0W7R2_9MICO|nr:TetR/AcrR family transcriptional regulator [Subtercola boreus]RFA17943.1 hypothetical protein B7R24_14845 [Subtercola boreus]RFA18325.1 hypothetical protein B7R23_14880 [Subtercola boreus]RFA24855.1 hypothetical protein B7R25_14875 [Subtercola boreus]
MPVNASSRPDPSEELKAVALRLFVETSYAGASLQQIADAAGYSKSSVLYHFASKEALLEAALTPALNGIEAIFENLISRITDDRLRLDFIDEFVDFLLEYGLEAHIIINQGQSLAGIPAIDRARQLIQHLGDKFMTGLPTTEQRIRLGIALAGAAYVVAISVPLQSAAVAETDVDVRRALVDVISEILIPFHMAPAVAS